MKVPEAFVSRASGMGDAQDVVADALKDAGLLAETLDIRVLVVAVMQLGEHQK